MIKGSFSHCNEFINSPEDYQTDSDNQFTDKKTLNSIDLKGDGSTASDKFKSEVRFIFEYLSDSLTDNVIEICKSLYPETSEFYDRSDILVFITIMSILGGNSRDVLLNWSNSIDADRSSIERFKKNLVLLGYSWVENIDERFDELQRTAALMWPMIMHSKGTMQAVLSVIKYCYLSDPTDITEPLMDSILILEATDAVANTANILIASPYTRQPNPNDPDYSDQVVYHSVLKQKLEEVRPMGVLYVFPDYEVPLEMGMDGGSYYRHRYFDDTYNIVPFSLIENTGIDRTSVVDSYETPTEMVPLSVSYKYQIASTCISNVLSLIDMYYIDFNDIRSVQFLSNNFELYLNSINPSYIIAGDNPTVLNTVNDYNLRDITRRGFLTLGNMEFSIESN